MISDLPVLIGTKPISSDFWMTSVISYSSAEVGWLEFNVPFQHKYGYIRDERSGVESYPLSQ